GAGGLRGRDRPRLVRRTQAARDHLRPRTPRPVSRRRRVHRHRAAPPRLAGVRADARRLVHLEAASIGELIDLCGLVATVTGAARGFGFASSRRLAEAGASVLLTDRRADRLEAAVRRLADYGDRIASAVGDISAPDEVDLLVAAAVDRFGRLDVLVNNAAAY